MINARDIATGAAIGLALAVLVGAGTVGNPLSIPDALSRIRPGVARWAMREIIDANTTSNTVSIVSASSVPACIPDRATVVVSSIAEATCAVSLTYNATLGSQTTDAATTLTDANGPDGPAAARTIAAGGEWHQTIDVSSLRTNYGARSGVCAGYQATANAIQGFRLRPPCRIDADCEAEGTAAGVTCDLAPTQAMWDESCAFVVCRALAADTDVTTSMEY